MPMTLKMLTKQHADFEASQARKAARATAKVERVSAKVERDRQWMLTQEHQRKAREAREMAADQRQQQRLEEDPHYHIRMGD